MDLKLMQESKNKEFINFHPWKGSLVLQKYTFNFLLRKQSAHIVSKAGVQSFSRLNLQYCYSKH